MSDINYVIGDATYQELSSNTTVKIIAHICNDVGAWGKGFVTAISKRWDEPEEWYRQWFKKKIVYTNANSEYITFELGNILLVSVDYDITICNMIAQHDIKSINNIPPIRYDALKECLIKLRKYILDRRYKSFSVNMPKIGSGLAGGDWNIIEKIIIEELCTYDIKVNVYTLKET